MRSNGHSGARQGRARHVCGQRAGAAGLPAAGCRNTWRRHTWTAAAHATALAGAPPPHHSAGTAAASRRSVCPPPPAARQRRPIAAAAAAAADAAAAGAKGADPGGWREELLSAALGSDAAAAALVRLSLRGRLGDSMPYRSAVLRPVALRGRRRLQLSLLDARTVRRRARAAPPPAPALCRLRARAWSQSGVCFHQPPTMHLPLMPTCTCMPAPT